MSRKIDLKGKKFGRLTVLEDVGRDKSKQVIWLCQCSCSDDSTCEVRSSHLRSGHTQSCNCLQKERTIEAHKTHGHCTKFNPSPTYTAWHGVIQRCTNPNSKAYRYYGAKGITVCDRWLRFENFLEDMGSKPEGMTLDRINTYLGYYPENCRWATWEQQRHNRRASKKYYPDGKQLDIFPAKD